jgi:hypothetical protein
VSALAKFAALPRARRRLLLRAVLSLSVFRAALALLPFRWVRNLAAPPPRGGPARATVDDLTWSVLAAARRLRSTCLTDALALQYLLHREGHRAGLRIGVAKTEAGALEAHAWLVADDRVLVGGPQSARFATLPLPDETAAQS